MKKLLTIFVILNLLLSFNSLYVFAQSTGSGSSGCCLFNKNSGQYCNNVRSGVGCEEFRAGLSCDQRNECEIGCCVGGNSCSTKVSRLACEQSGGSFRRGLCEAVSDCKEGGCVLGKQCLFTTSFDCKDKSKQFGVRQMDFRATMTETECNLYTVSNLPSGSGCCITENGCRTSSQSQCSGEFKAKSCNSVNDARCLPANCKVGGKNFYLVERDPSSKLNLPDQEITISRFMLGNEDIRYNGDSWCVVSTNAGNIVGSSHYVYTCVNGRVISQACSVFRDTICKQDSTYSNERSITSAKCVPNEDKKNYPVGGYFYPENERKQPIVPGNVDPYVQCPKCGTGILRGWFNRCGAGECRELGDCTYQPPGIGTRAWSGLKTGTAFAAAAVGFMGISGAGVGGAGWGLPFISGGGIGGTAAPVWPTVLAAVVKVPLRSNVDGIVKGAIITYSSQKMILLVDENGRQIDNISPWEELEVIETSVDYSRVKVRTQNGEEGYLWIGNNNGEIPLDEIKVISTAEI